MSDVPESIEFTLLLMQGGPDAYLISRCVGRLRELFKLLRCRDYSTKLVLFAICIKGDGALVKFGSEGIKNLRLMKRESMWADIVVPARIWEEGGVEALRIYLAANIFKVFENFVKRAADRKVYLEGDALLSDVADVLEQFLRDEGEYEAGWGEIQVQAALRRFHDLRRLAAALGDRVPGPGVPEGWEVSEDPSDERRVLYRRIPQRDSDAGGP